MLCCALMACKKNSVDFTFSPTAPKAGETVYFTNQSTSGEDWSWTFGDGTVSTIKSPSHAYKQPGTYVVTLQVDKNNAWKESKQITVYDTIPSYACADSVFTIYQDYTFEAMVYNPYNYDVSYWWHELTDPTAYVMPYFVVTDSVRDAGKLHLYFTRPMEEAPLSLRVILNGDTTNVNKSFNVSDRATNSVLFRTPEDAYRQRIFGARAESYFPTVDTMLLHNETDTVQTYNGYDFHLSALQTVFPGMQGFHIASRKIYYRANGLWVANIDGAYQVQIDTAECYAMTLDTKDSRIYWANANGVWYMPFVGSDNNRFVTVPVQLNDLTPVTKMAADTEKKLKYQ